MMKRKMFLNRLRAQGTLEYAVLLGVVVVAMLAAAKYVERGLQGRNRRAGQQLSEIPHDPEAGHGTTRITTTSISHEETDVESNVFSTTINDSTTMRENQAID